MPSIALERGLKVQNRGRTRRSTEAWHSQVAGRADAENEEFELLKHAVFKSLDDLPQNVQSLLFQGLERMPQPHRFLSNMECYSQYTLF